MAIGTYIYEFGRQTDGDASRRALLGGKGANLAEMARIQLPVPPGFTLTTGVCALYRKAGGKLPEELWEQVQTAVQHVEEQQHKRFGDADNPLLFSVRSGARESMPGMMDTILNLGLNDATVIGLKNKTQNGRFAQDCYRRFIQMYGDVVLGIHAPDEHAADPFEEILKNIRQEAGVAQDPELDESSLQELIRRYQELIRRQTGREFPQEVGQQLRGAIGAVFESWDNERAVIYRRKYNIPSEWGTAVNVQAMVFGNQGNRCATGVAFTRNPATGEKQFYGEYLVNAQGEDVVAGIRTPQPIAAMEGEMPGSYAALLEVRQKLEEHFCDMQDFEFTIEQDRLYMLQTRNGKRTGLAAVRIAVEMVEEEKISQEEALRRIPADSISGLLVPVFDEGKKASMSKIAQGLPAGPGAASGKICFSAKRAEELQAQGERIILCRQETSPEDIRGMLASEGILTSRGGVSSHAALVARQMGKVCVCGATAIEMDYASQTLRCGEHLLHEGEALSLDGTTGEVFLGSLATVPSEVNRVLAGQLSAEESTTYRLFDTLMTWADRRRRLGVRANADTPAQAAEAFALGAEGIGLCRTEHMFFEGQRIDFMREMILAESVEERKAALAKLKPLQRGDFEAIFRAMQGRPVTIRLLDPPLHEFLPQDEETMKALARRTGLELEKIRLRVAVLHEQNPMLGHRGCRLGISYPEISEMQATAVFEAAAQVLAEGIPVAPEIMVPLVGFTDELRHQAALIHAAAQCVMRDRNCVLAYTVGTMIELPRAALVADAIAQEAQFFSFGTNDLTQTTLGMSRDDSGSFLPQYVGEEIVKRNPFATLDVEGVGQLMQLAVERGRRTKSDLKVGICGEHGGDPDTIQFCHHLGLSYVSCSPKRVPVARLAAAQAALKAENS
ncbi:MAG: pyruvate, phosphate dikinase [Puniceicoccales bacterium]|jgi:pyruvate,orthophosphate dikinase|nr:pyruvate, phosphate dikinase [Puniceicoccales bacterium]